MRVIVPVKPAARLLTSTVAEPDAGWPAYSALANYTDGARVTSGGQTYQSRQINNQGNPLPVAPAIATEWWDVVTETPYVTGTTYGLGARVVSPTSHRIYESSQASNTGNPLPVPPITQTDWWLEVGATNRHACLDELRSTQTIAASPLVLQIRPGQRVNSIGVTGMESDDLRIQMHTGAGVLVYDKAFDLRRRVVRDAYEYAFKPFDLQPSVVQFDLPPYSDAVITLTLTRSTGIVKLGSVDVGNYVYMGEIQKGAENDTLNFSVTERDDFAKPTLRPRRSPPITTQVCEIPKRYVNDLLDARERLNALPAVWSGLDDAGADDWFEAFLIRGFYKRFSINTQYSATHALVTLNLEEV